MIKKVGNLAECKSHVLRWTMVLLKNSDLPQYEEELSM